MQRLTDLRFIIGIFFFFAGLIVLVASFAAGDSGKENGAHINLYSGIGYMIFGFGMWYSSRKPVQ